MTVHVGELTTEVAVESAQHSAPQAPSQKEPGWMERDRLRRVREAVERDCARVAAEGFGD